MRNYLKCSSLIRVAIIIVVMAFLAGQVTDTYAGKKCKDGQHNFDKRGKCKRCKKIVKIIINKNGGSVDCSEIEVKFDEIISKIDAIECDGGGEPADCDVCPPPEGIEKSWVPKTGQTTLSVTGDDGDLEKGIPWPVDRFTINQDGTVTDKLTCLIWDQDANRPNGRQQWANAVETCDKSEANGHDDWRLPNVRELQSLIHYGVISPALPNTAGTDKHGVGGDTFNNVQSSFYWSSTTDAVNSANAWFVDFFNGNVNVSNKGFINFVWCVRGGP